ncbi:hypothetical protein [Treponema pedis]|uniref:Uncharacterized protein n=2 Tax=Treponema pedis TaxID=409322 RepID=S5ZVH6_9SPIR|nr:hypothetical protein [Treponema pedis]AGT44295.1 hypothetical protein TPE_1821 [Treponema pedis str. T A4]QOW62059.1 hypothetical protein IFE08_06940 [Treponema pedis]QSI04998.1 hypothetical protein DYQ05_08750 [Treponema pedis]
MLEILIVAVISAVCSLFNLSVGLTGLRITLGIIVLAAALQRNAKLNVIIASAFAGIGVCIVRILVSGVSSGFSIYEVFNHSLEILFYLGYGIFYYVLVRSEKSVYKTHLILLLMLCDFGANTIEYAARHFLLSSSSATSAMETAAFQTIFLAAFIRSSLIWIIAKFAFNAGEPARKIENSENGKNTKGEN